MESEGGLGAAAFLRSYLHAGVQRLEWGLRNVAGHGPRRPHRVVRGSL